MGMSEKINEKVLAEMIPRAQAHAWPNEEEQAAAENIIRVFCQVATGTAFDAYKDATKEKLKTFFIDQEDPVTPRKKLYKTVVYQSTRLFAGGVLQMVVALSGRGLSLCDKATTPILQTLALQIHQQACELILQRLQERGISKSALAQLRSDYATAVEQAVAAALGEEPPAPAAADNEPEPDAAPDTEPGNTSPPLVDSLLGWLKK